MEKWMIEENAVAVCSSELCSDLLRELWRGFTFGKSEITLLPTNETVFLMGEAEPAPIPQGKEYSVSVGDEGVAVAGRSDAALMRGIFAFLRGLACDSPEEDGVYHVHGLWTDAFDVGVRMAHLCVFPETELDYIKKLVRFCGALQYTHIILEFWGMFRFDCMRELGWPMAFSKAQVRELADEIRLLGMEAVPMFNHLGHASGSRGMHGKHVVLDQNPTLAPYFGPDGWNWNIKSEAVLRLLKNVRLELCEAFGGGEYFHLGVDECYLYGTDYALADELRDFLVRVCAEVLEEGRRPILWGDMFLCHKTLDTKKKGYACNCLDQRIADTVLSALDKRVIFADWHYYKTDGTFITTPYFQKWGFEVLCCPWDDPKNIKMAVNTAREYRARGVIETTWHTLENGLHTLLICSELCKEAGENGDLSFTHPRAATVLRKVWPRFNGYESCGWKKQQIPR